LLGWEGCNSLSYALTFMMPVMKESPQIKSLCYLDNRPQTTHELGWKNVGKDNE